MVDNQFAAEVLKVAIAQVCQNIGWHAVQSSPMDILSDVLQRYIRELSKCVKNYCNQYNRIEPNLDDLGLSFKDIGIVLSEIEEYINNVEPVTPIYTTPHFPVKHLSNLQYPKLDSRELQLRPEHIPSYLPPMHPDLEEDAIFNPQSVLDGLKKDITNGDSPVSSPKQGVRRIDWPQEISNSKKNSRFFEEEGRPMREVTSVFMTPAGFISPVHEGKVPEASLPCLVDSPPPTPEPHPFSVSSKKDIKLKEVKKDRSKSKKDSAKKDAKKLKSSKKERENKENAVNKSVTSSGSKKEHCSSSHKSSKAEKNMKSEDIVQQKVKSDKMKLKAQKEESRKVKDSFKTNKIKTKLKHSSGSGSSSRVKSSKLSNSKASKAAKASKLLKLERTKLFEPDIVLPPPPKISAPKEVPFEPNTLPVESNFGKTTQDEMMDVDDDLDFREESPESRLVIDDSLETQARQERESRLEVIDECIEAVIRRGEEESEIENRNADDSINSVARGFPPGIRKLEAKDIYDFTDTSNSSSLSSCDISVNSPVHTPTKKEKKANDGNKKPSESPRKSKKKKKSKELKALSPEPYMSPKSQKSSNFILRTDDRTPSPILKDDLLSSDGSTPSSSPRSNSYFDQSPQRPSHVQPSSSSLFSHIPQFSGSNYSMSPFAPLRNMPGHLTPNFPTPPLFVSSKAENSTFQPLNLAKSGSSVKSSPDKPDSNIKDSSDNLKKTSNILEKPKTKETKKEKGKKKFKRETEKNKEKKEKEDIKEIYDEKKKSKVKEKPRSRLDKSIKLDKRKPKPEKKKAKEKESKEDSTVPKMTLKLSSGAGSTKIFVKPNTKHSTSLSSNSSLSDEDDNNVLETMSPTPSPPKVPTPPPMRIPSPSPPPKARTPSPVPPPPITTKPLSSRGRGRGKKAAAQVVVPPPARTVITETVGTIVDESGNKIWICPACSRADDGSPMIGCDECDDWYHWVCVGIIVPPKEEENWFCTRCISKRQTPAIKRRRKKHKKEK